jgi:chromosome partitioning protein
MLDERTNLAQQVMGELRKYLGTALCETTIPRNIRLAEAPSHGKPVLVYDVRSRGAESYIRLAKEIIAHHMPQAAPVEATQLSPVIEAPAGAEVPVVAADSGVPEETAAELDKTA